MLLRYRGRLALLVKANDYGNAAVLEVERVRMTLGSESDYRTHFSIEVSEVGVFIRVDFCCHILI
jgi:hypothetical protein